MQPKTNGDQETRYHEQEPAEITGSRNRATKISEMRLQDIDERAGMLTTFMKRKSKA